MIAAEHGHVERIKELLAAGAEKAACSVYQPLSSVFPVIH